MFNRHWNQIIYKILFQFLKITECVQTILWVQGVQKQAWQSLAPQSLCPLFSVLQLPSKVQSLWYGERNTVCPSSESWHITLALLGSMYLWGRPAKLTRDGSGGKKWNEISKVPSFSSVGLQGQGDLTYRTDYWKKSFKIGILLLLRASNWKP